jgi:hypothetical protein
VQDREQRQNKDNTKIITKKTEKDGISGVLPEVPSFCIAEKQGRIS